MPWRVRGTLPTGASLAAGAVAAAAAAAAVPAAKGQKEALSVGRKVVVTGGVLGAVAGAAVEVVAVVVAGS